MLPMAIAEHEETRFIQPSSSAIALNRINSGDPTNILGQLRANGQVLLINPNGILFCKNARVDVAGLVATTTDIGSDGFLSERLDFQRRSRADRPLL